MPSTRSTTKTCPSRRSKSKTPWCAKHSMPVTRRARRSCGVLPRGALVRPGWAMASATARASRVARTSCTRRSRPRGRRAGRPGPRGRARARRPGAACRRAASREPRKRLAAGPDEQRATQRPSRRRGGPAAASCARRAWRTPARGRGPSGRGRSRRRPPPRGARRARGTTAPTTPPGPSYVAKSAIRSLWARQCMATYVAPESATTSRIAGSARPPDTSLTMRAPASSAAAATSDAHGVDRDAAPGGRRGRR